jgi:DNA repair protein RadD
MILRPYQAAAIDAVAAWGRERGGEHPLVVLPTGAGKTATMTGLVRHIRTEARSARVLLLAHRKELLEQTATTALRMFPTADVGIYAASLKRKDRHAPITVAGIQSLQRDAYAIGAQDVVVVDECHLVPPDEGTGFRKALAALAVVNPAVMVVGFTATPYRLGTGLLHTGDGALFGGIAYEVGIPELLADGYLCPVRPRHTATRLSTDGVAVRGDYVPAALAAAVDVDATTRAIVGEIVTECAARNCVLVFGCSVEHSDHLADALRTAGETAVSIHGKLTPAERAERLAVFRSGAVKFATTCDLLTTGFDHPAIDAIALVRPTKSPGLYYQMVGRAFRPHHSKVDALVLDFGGNVMRHGPVDTLAARIREPRGVRGEGIAPAKECDCGALIAASALVCPECGHEFPPPAPVLERVAATKPLLSTDVALPEWRDVTDVVASATQPRDPSKRPTMRVDYLAGFKTVASEWVCVEHDNFARDKAVAWWADRFPSEACPTSAGDAADIVSNADPRLVTPSAICVRADGEFERVIAYRWPPERAALLRPASTLPRACWTCAAWSGEVCTLASIAPPEEVQQAGCELWSEMDDADEFARAFGVAA